MHGVTFILEPEIAKHILEITYLSDSIIVLSLLIGDTKTTYTQIYVPWNNDEEDNEDYYEMLNDVITHIEMTL
jgi:hypothetical protein